MGTINTAIQLANIRSKIDAQQQVVSLLEVELQKAILGDDRSTIGSVLGLNANGSPNTTSSNTIYSIYKGLSGPEGVGSYGNGDDLWDAFINPIENMFDYDQNLTSANETLDQTAIRQMLYQARALLGEMRVEEQHWNQEVNEEKARRKDLAEFAKG